jgi:hypothetical protein
MPRLPIWLIILAVMIVGTPLVAMLLDVTMGPGLRARSSTTGR